MNKFIPLMLGLTLLSGSVAMAAPTVKSSKTTHRTACKKHITKKATSKTTGAKKLVAKK